MPDDAVVDAREPTLIDVARMAKVAPSTASRALHESPRISESTKRRVQAAAESLGYQPNRIARSLRTRNGSFVGIVVPDIGIGFYSRVVKGAQDVLEHAGRAVLLMNTEREAEREEAAVRMLLEHRVSGILLASSGSAASAPRVPTVFFDNLPSCSGVASVALMNAAGIAMLVEHLAQHGHTRIAYIGGPPTLTSGVERLGGFDQTVRRLGLDERVEYVQLSDAAWSPESAVAAMERLLALPEPPTAVVASGDTLALGALSACRAAGLRLPDDMALASFDDPFFGGLLDPPLTALARDEAEMGRRAASLLLDALESGASGPPVEVLLPVELVVRRSCGCP
ncbi:MAG TPA: LacI family DNA-binding transcriptional regulator [Gaiellaceae bacterium]